MPEENKAVDENEIVETVVDSDKENENNSPVTNWESEAEKWKELSRKNEGSSKENFKKLNDLSAKYDALSKDLEDTQKFKDQNLSLLKRAVIAEKGLPANLAGRLNGSTEEELLSDADDLLELFGEVKRTPKPIKSQGSDNESKNKPPLFKTREEYLNYYQNK